VSATSILLLGTLAGALGSIPDLETAGTIYDLGVAHLVLVAAITASLGGIHWWATKIGRQPANESLGRLAPLVLLSGAVVTALPDLISGIAGEDLELAADWTGGIESLNLIVLIGSAILLFGLLVAVVSLRRLFQPAGQGQRDPWDGQTLEWLTASPPPLGNFDAPLPVVTSAEPLVDLREEN